MHVYSMWNTLDALSRAALSDPGRAVSPAEAADEPPPEPSALAVMPLARLLTWRTTWARQAVAVAMEQRKRAGEGAAAGAWVMPVAFALLAERSVADESEWAPYLGACARACWQLIPGTACEC